MKKSKPILSVVCLILSMVMVLSACGKPKNPNQDPPDTQPETMTIAEYVDALGNDEYTFSGLTGTYGLSEDENVGVNKSKTNEIKYPVAADSAFESDAIIDFETFDGIYSNDTERWTAVFDSASSINQNGKDVKVKLPNRTIDLIASADSAITLRGFNGLHIEGGEQTILMIDTPAAWLPAMSINSCEDLHIQDVKIDYKVSPTITGIVKSVNMETLEITMDIPISFNSTVTQYMNNSALGGTLHSYIEYDKYTLAPREGGNILIRNDGFFDTCIFDMDGDAASVVVKFSQSYVSRFKAPRIGELVALGFAMYGNNAISVSASKNIYFESCTIYTCPGMGFVASKVENLYVNRFNIILNGDRRMTATADGMHFEGCTGDVFITNSIIENTHDDALNIKAGYYYELSSTDSISRTLTIVRKTSNIPMAKAGDVLEVYGKDTFDLRGRFTVVSAQGTEANQVITVKERIEGSVDWTNCVITNTSISPKFEFINNIVRNKRNRGILIQVRDVVIENNAFKNVGHGSISIHSSLDVFNEATMPKDIVVRNNKLINNGYLPYGSLRGDITAFAITSNGTVAPSGTIKGIKISNNYIENSANAGISLRGVGTDTDINNNLFYNVARKSASEMTECVLELENVSDVKVSYNYNYYTLESETFSGIITAGLTKKENIILTGNTNLNYQEISGEVSNTLVSKITAPQVVIDGELIEWTDMGTSVEMVGSSLATGDSIDPQVYQDVFGVEMCKIAWSEAGIYFVFKVRDNKANFQTENNFWNGDCVEIFLTEILNMPNADFKLYRNDGDVFQLALVPSWMSGFTIVSNRSNDNIVDSKALMNIKVKTVTDGYQGEVFMPFSVLPGVAAIAGTENSVAIAFVFADADRDDIGRKRLQVSNVPHFVESYKTKTAKMPRFTFIND